MWEQNITLDVLPWRDYRPVELLEPDKLYLKETIQNMRTALAQVLNLQPA